MYKSFFKRVIDIACALMFLPFFLIAFIIVAPFIYFQDRGPIFYNAPRLGKNGRVFTMYKFRSMKINAPDLRNPDGSTYNAEDDPRLTPIGKWIRKTSLDELPQILNVLKGDMSIVGPRPDLPEHRELYVDNEERKLEVRPGITGYNQAYYRNAIPWKDRIQLDIYYIDHLTFILDLKILLRTVLTVLSSRNVFVKKNKS